MHAILDRPLTEVARALRTREVSAAELADEALDRHARHGARLHAYKLIDPARARAAAGRADRILAEARRSETDAPPLCGIPVSVKDLYGVKGLPTFAGTTRRLPDRWSRDAWLVERLRAQGAVFIGKTHTVELAYGAVGINPHWGTPWNPWDADVHRAPGGSSSGAGVSLLEGSALVALGSDTGGSIRIPASMTGTVGHKTTKGRWPTDGVVPLSHTLDTVGALTRSVADSAWFFDAVDPAFDGPSASTAPPTSPVRVGVPGSTLWTACSPDLVDLLHEALDELGRAGWRRIEAEGDLVDAATDLYIDGGIAGAECRAFLAAELPGWMELLHPVVGRRLAGAASDRSPSYRASLRERARLEEAAGSLFDSCDVLVLPTVLSTPPEVAQLEELDRYIAANTAALRPTCGVGILGLCAVTLPVALDARGMPVGLQFVGRANHDRRLLAIARAAERVLGTPRERLGIPPCLRPGPPPPESADPQGSAGAQETRS